jgi:hypothetical protein
MRPCFAILAIAVSMCLLSNGAVAQAAAEGALTHALSSGVGSSLGNAMGKATNQMAGRVAQQTSRATARPAATAVVKHPGSTAVTSAAASSENAVPAARAPNNGSMIVSIQGAVRQQPACAATANADASAAPSGTSANSASAAPAPVADCNKTVDPTTFAHPSEITLPSPK